MADGPDDTDQGGAATVASRDWRAELAGATGGRVAPVAPQPEARALPASWDPGAGTTDPQLRAHARPMATPTVEAAEQPGGDVLPQRLIEALATVLGRRLDAIDVRLDDMTVADGQPVESVARALAGSVERLDAAAVELHRTVSALAAGSPPGADAASPALVERLAALAAGIERAVPAPAVEELTVAVSDLAARLAGVEHRLRDLVPPAGAATVDDVLERMSLVEPPAGAATVDDVLERLNLLEPPPGAATVDDVLERLSALAPPPGAATLDDVLARLDALAAAVAPPPGVPAGGLDLAKVLGGRLDAVIARLAHLEATMHQAAMRPEVGRDVPEPAGTGSGAGGDHGDPSTFERLERQIIELNRILR